MAKISDFILIGAIAGGGYLLYKSGILSGIQGIGGVVTSVGQIPGTVVNIANKPFTMPSTGGATSPGLVDLHKAGSGQQGYIYTPEGIGIIDPNARMPKMKPKNMESGFKGKKPIVQPKGKGTKPGSWGQQPRITPRARKRIRRTLKIFKMHGARSSIIKKPWEKAYKW